MTRAKGHVFVITKIVLVLELRIAFYTNRVERINQLFLQPDIITAGIDEVSSNTKPLIRQIRKLPKRVNEEEASLFGMSWLLFASVIYVPIFQKIPGDKFGMVHRGLAWLLQKDGIQMPLSELFYIQLSVERLSTMKKYVFGLGSAQVVGKLVLVTAVVVGLVSRFIAGQPSPAAIIIGDGLALSSTAVVLQVTVNEQLCIAGMRDVPSSAALPIIRPALGRQHSISDRAKVAMQGYLNHFLSKIDIVNSRKYDPPCIYFMLVAVELFDETMDSDEDFTPLHREVRV
ncbi:hypothetical protein HYC85_022978 [Camellia sinensis]|uniref:Uncharacterized protein n=1 Tax=Camellia sinensis TaxID=4442 RepID=A0A7J7GD64_CAMSI|nr:hypothetical protein HYC85_022978 [Camellia sinensis]